MVLEKTLESSLDSKIKPVNPKGNQSWIFIGRTDAEAETPILWSPEAMNWLIWKDSDAGKDWRQEEKGTTEDEMVGWHYRLDGYEFEQTPGVGDGQGGLACCRPWGCKESDTTERLSWTEDGASGKEPTCRQHRRHETWVPSLGREDPLEKGMATHSSHLAWRIPWTEESGGLESKVSWRVGHNWSDLAPTYALGLVT